MEARLIVAVVFVCAVCHVTEAQLQTTKSLGTNITLTGCGSTKLCVSNPSNCDPAGNSSCFFSSTQLSNAILTVELSGTTSGYVALGLTPTSSQTQQLIQGTAVFVCGNNNNSTFFETAIQNGSVLTPANLTAINITSVQGSVTRDQSLIQCVFNITLNSILLSSILIKATVQLSFNIAILNGNTNGTDLGNAAMVFNSKGSLNLADPKSNIPNHLQLSITRNSCGSTKECVSFPSNCDPAGTSSCFFVSIQLKNQMFFFELSGTTAGYVALGLNKQGTTILFACINISNSFFFQTAIQKGQIWIPANVTVVYNVQGVVAQNPSLIQCIFNTSASFTISNKSDETSFSVSILSGTTNEIQLGNAAIMFDSKVPLNPTDPTGQNSSNSIVSRWTHVLVLLLSALTLRLQ
ncbi:putative ferric-chelate reductase 1 [Ictalurus furcatus]|uniref:putative ferric-chelate reductase 1 n=1 Tax=Ictalurus furcatus TaxID=66913 RepID=UPI002350AED2|nr:putative ferric-chelate reductase 1 [Ictalurus furcatus]